MNEEQFRRQLERILKCSICREQTQLLLKLKETYPHSIEVVEEAVQGRPETFRYNCFVYALNIDHRDPKNPIMILSKQEADKNRNTDIFVGVKFVEFCISSKYLVEVKSGNEKIKDGDIIMYFDNRLIPKHAGKMKKGRVVSKWGGSGNLYEHDIWEIPINYGNRVKYFRGFSQIGIVEFFERYAKSKGLIDCQTKYNGSLGNQDGVN